MLKIISILLITMARKSLENESISELLKKHPTWSFELESVDLMVKKKIEAIKDNEPSVTEHMLREKIKRELGPEATHIVRKIGDPRWPRALPENFDIRDKFKDCAHLIGDVQDEGVCHADSAVVVASMASDRLCIFTNGTHKELLSAEYLIGCAEICTSVPEVGNSFKTATKVGLPSGGRYHSNSGCLPYKDAPCQHSRQDYLGQSGNQMEETLDKKDKLKPCYQMMTYDRECHTKCSNPKYPKPLKDDLKKFTSSYFTSRNDYALRSEIYTLGSVVTSIDLYDDFLNYKHAFYKHITMGVSILVSHVGTMEIGDPIGLPNTDMKGELYSEDLYSIYYKDKNAEWMLTSKFFKLIGWGKENGTKYWLAVNSWSNWGEKKVVKIPRGIDYLYVEWAPRAGTFGHL